MSRAKCHNFMRQNVIGKRASAFYFDYELNGYSNIYSARSSLKEYIETYELQYYVKSVYGSLFIIKNSVPYPNKEIRALQRKYKLNMSKNTSKRSSAHAAIKRFLQFGVNVMEISYYDEEYASFESFAGAYWFVAKNFYDDKVKVYRNSANKRIYLMTPEYYKIYKSRIPSRARQGL